MRKLPFLAILLCLACDGTAFDPQQRPPKSLDIPGDDVPPTDTPAADTTLPDVPDPGLDTGDTGTDPGDPADAEVRGCTDPEANNYDPSATKDDGSCLFNVKVTFHVDMTCRKDLKAPQIAGGNSFGDPGDNPLEDPDKDGIWTRSFTVPSWLGTSYTFTTDDCVTYNCKEPIDGQPCSVEPYDHRYLSVADQDMDVRACFGVCGVEVCGQCPAGAPAPDPVPSCASPQVKVRFRVDLAGAWATAQNHVIALQGDWAAAGPGIVMTRLPPPDHRVYEAVACLDPDHEYLYRFAGYQGSILEFADGAYTTDAPPCPDATRTEACGETTCTRRVLTTAKADLELPVVEWAGCPGG